MNPEILGLVGAENIDFGIISIWTILGDDRIPKETLHKRGSRQNPGALQPQDWERVWKMSQWGGRGLAQDHSTVLTATKGSNQIPKMSP